MRLNKINIHPFFLIIFATFLWATDLIVKSSDTTTQNIFFTITLEYFFGLLFLLPLAIKRIGKELFKFNLKDFLMLLFIGIGGSFIAGLMLTESLKIIGPNSYSFFQILQPIFVTLLAVWFLNEKFDQLYITWSGWMLVSAILINYSDFEVASLEHFQSKGVLLALGAMMIWALCTIFGKKLLVKYDPLFIVTWRWGVALITSLLVLLFGHQGDLTGTLEWMDMFKFIFSGVVAGGLAMWIYYAGLRHLSASITSFLELSYSAFGIILSTLFLYRKLEFITMLGVLSFIMALWLLAQNEKIEDL